MQVHVPAHVTRRVDGGLQHVCAPFLAPPKSDRVVLHLRWIAGGKPSRRLGVEVAAPSKRSKRIEASNPFHLLKHAVAVFFIGPRNGYLQRWKPGKSEQEQKSCLGKSYVKSITVYKLISTIGKRTSRSNEGSSFYLYIQNPLFQ